MERSARTTTFVSATQLTAQIGATDIATAGSVNVTVTLGTAVSNAMAFTITSGGTTPTITSVTPHYATVGIAAVTLNVIGTNFVSGAVVNWGTTALTTTFVSATKLTAAVPAANLKTVGTYQITVKSSGGTSNEMPFTVAPATHGPIAYGYFNKDATAGATSGNITCQWLTANLEYYCTLSGEDFYYSKYVVNVTVGTTADSAFVGVNSGLLNGVDGVLVKFRNAAGTAVQEPFYIVVFKP
jgi:hypothetical protein